MDEIDRKIIAALEQNARASTSELGRRLGLARTTVQSRIERLESTGAILGYTVRIGQGDRRLLRATVLLSYEPQTAPSLLARLNALPEVRAARTTSGRFDMLVEVAAHSTEELDHILDRICSAKGVKSSESLIHLSNKIERG
ncbi:MAG: Lrp/AsnC family transcriptional regulator [Paracoccaceae bacterium]|jgi:DNA-binding Lrp family transcriptional regulator|nr:Lrp/AsnC family transcriptional regulator [Paracoccaceae bacterium]MDP7185730.1 Lrp/AsnC family transcriptional regulator [Paracoccaceae bacterium]